MRKFLLIIVGPTAVGKSQLSIELAKEFNTEIISADSRQFYNELNIGTAKPTSEEMQGIPHHFINSHSIFENYDVSDFEKDVIFCLEKLFKKHSIVILTGGTGLYVRAICNGLDSLPAADASIREKLNQVCKTGGLKKLQKQLQLLDPLYYNKVDIQNPQRLIRAIEVCLITGKPYSSFLSGKPVKRNFIPIKIGLIRDREELYTRINERVEKMLGQGWLEEARKLYPHKHLPSLQTVGYQELFDYIKNKVSWEETVQLIKQNTRRYAKRQLTWFKKDKDITWFHPNDKQRIISFIERQITIPD